MRLLCLRITLKGKRHTKSAIYTIKRHERRKKLRRDIYQKKQETNKRYIKNLSNLELAQAQINLLSRGLKFIPTHVTNESHIRAQLLNDFKAFARQMRLQYIFYGQDKEPHSFHVKSNWEPPVQPSVTLESYLEEVKTELAEVKISKAKNNLPPINERQALKELKQNINIIIKKAEKGTTTVIMNKQDKTREGQNLLDKKENYKPLTLPMALETSQKAKELINGLHHGDPIDEMTKKWLYLAPNPPRIPVFYTLTKIHKPNPVGRPIISGCEGPTERISSFVDHLLQPIAKIQKSYLKDTTDFLSFVEKTKVAKDTFPVSMDVTSL